LLFIASLAVDQAAQAMRSLQRKLLLEEDLRMPLLQLEGEEILGKERHVQNTMVATYHQSTYWAIIICFINCMMFLWLCF